MVKLRQSGPFDILLTAELILLRRDRIRHSEVKVVACIMMTIGPILPVTRLQ